MSEGVESVRRVAFKKMGNSYLEGYGEMEDKEGKKVFSNPGSLQFNSQVVLSEVNCEK